MEKDGEVLYEIAVEGEKEEGLTDRNLLNMKDIWDFAMTVDVKDIKETLDRQIAYNTAIAEEGLRGDYGANIGSVLLDTYGDDIRTRAKAKAAAGSDARMNGCELPVIINSGSGNQGMTSSIPVIEYAKEFDADEDTLYRALALSNSCYNPPKDRNRTSFCILWSSQRRSRSRCGNCISLWRRL